MPLPPLDITVVGKSTITHNAERALLSLHVAAQDTDQEAVSNQVTSTVNQLHQLFKDHSPRTEATGEISPDAAITVFTTTSMRSSSMVPDRDSPRQYRANCNLEVTFRDFSVLSEIASTLLTTPNVEISSVAWRLTSETTKRLVAEARLQALQNAIEQAEGYSRIVDRKVYPVEIKTSDRSHSSGRGKPKQAARTYDTASTGGTTGLKVEAEDVVTESKVDVRFATEDWERPKLVIREDCS